MFTFSELLNQWLLDNSSNLANKTNYLEFKSKIEEFYDLAHFYYRIKEDKNAKNSYFDIETNALYELMV